jgi:dual specificity phosphatase 12
MQRYGITPGQALAQIRETRPFCEPNDGFMKQLELYHRMAETDDIEGSPVYQRWLYQREIEMSRACGQAPEAEKIRFEDEHESQGTSDFELKCKKCRYVTGATLTRLTDSLLIDFTSRRPLATSQYLTSHEPLRDSSGEKSSNTSPACGHFFLDALSWMRPELEQGKLDGRLECPKCRANVGKYAWQGMQCSCGDWVLPAISLQKARVDAARTRPTGSGAGGMGIRMPPGGRPSGGQNL